MTRLRFHSILLIVAVVGCGRQEKTAEPNLMIETPAATVSVRSEAVRPATPSLDKSKLKQMGLIAEGASATLVAVQPGATARSTASSAVTRKIVYDAQVDLMVESVDPIAKKVGSLVQEASGYIAEQNVTGSPGSQRSMRWRFRIPVERFDSFVDSIVVLGELERNNRTSEDITEQYYDLEARIKNKRLEEQTLSKILQERSGKLEDVLKIEIELSRVRGEIERLEGKIRVLENLSSLATLTLNVRERDKYAPPAPVVADFRTQIARVWDGSILDLANMGKAFVLWAVSWVIWLPFLLVGAIVAGFLFRWLIRVLLRNLPRIVALARTPITSPRTPTASERP
jgi:hypothetical protein